MDSEPLPRGALRDGESVLLVDRKGREYLRKVVVGGQISVRNGRFSCDDLIGQPDGREIALSTGERVLVLRPTYARLIPNLPRKAQVIYPKDTGPILIWGDVQAGLRVLEAGVGPGALTIALLRTVGPTGEVFSIEKREEFANMARENVARFVGETPNWHVRVGDVADPWVENDVDRVILDLPEPWGPLDHVAKALRPGGVFVGYVPTVLQVKALADALDTHEGFTSPEILETLVRPWDSEGRSLRPAHRMVAHTAFLLVSRRIVPLADSAGQRLDGGRGSRLPPG